MTHNLFGAFFEGWDSQAHQQLGAHPLNESDVGWSFRVWAPNAEEVFIVGDWNFWSIGTDRAHNRDGIWQAEVPEARAGQNYKFAIRPRGSMEFIQKADPFAREAQLSPDTASRLYRSGYQWNDAEFIANRRNDGPISIYEMHLGSWKRPDGKLPRYNEIGAQLIPYLKKAGFTHVEFMPLTHHPYYPSWGYQCLGYFAPTPMFGTPDDLRYLIDQLHQAGIGVLLDWVPAHFPMDDHGLYRFDGTAIFEHPDPRKGFHKDWNTAIFDYGRNEVRSFLLSSARFWLESFHFDGLRVDAVASMLYLDYSRDEGEWEPNDQGGNEYWEAVHFLRELSTLVREFNSGYLLVAEESTAWPGVTRQAPEGLGFTHKWDMGWMHDTLRYFERDPIHRKYHHNDLTFRGMYAFTEKYVLALSHDEVVYGKGSLIGKMSGDEWQKRAQNRLLLAMMYAQPGKKMIFMGMEFGQWAEWNFEQELNWELLEHEGHAGILNCISGLNRLYRSEKALGDDETEAGTFWSAVDDNENSVFAFIRRHDGEELLFVANCTPQIREDYQLGVPQPGRWQEIFSTDDIDFGGSGFRCLDIAFSEPNKKHGCEQSIMIGLPPLGASFWKRVPEE